MPSNRRAFRSAYGFARTAAQCLFARCQSPIDWTRSTRYRRASSGSGIQALAQAPERRTRSHLGTLLQGPRARQRATATADIDGGQGRPTVTADNEADKQRFSGLPVPPRSGVQPAKTGIVPGLRAHFWATRSIKPSAASGLATDHPKIDGAVYCPRQHIQACSTPSYRRRNRFLQWSQSPAGCSGWDAKVAPCLGGISVLLLDARRQRERAQRSLATSNPNAASRFKVRRCNRIGFASPPYLIKQNNDKEEASMLSGPQVSAAMIRKRSRCTHSLPRQRRIPPSQHLQLRRRARDTTVAPVRTHISQHPGFRLSSLLVVTPSLCDVHAVPTEPQLNFPGAQQYEATLDKESVMTDPEEPIAIQARV
ncbi:hypothetical protein CPLU01_01625 [Colletotrichum plurivorum]|uniref:Uncharacterized protein n=1 Tax=Colletotrichum plurivorum TaxID=2175906 RepID=A0A8H6KYX9_9PEZI|nr:hypothetical protein CPLU01_01625 [Colletotrichum plurivorum]